MQISLTRAAGKLPASPLPKTISERTRRVYDRVAHLYPASSLLLHMKAHRTAVESAGLTDGMRVLEVATGSGEMFRRLVKKNPSGFTVGLDISPNMASFTQKSVRRRFPHARTQCKAVDARFLPFREESFDAVVCCYLFELLSCSDIERTLSELQRVLRPGGKLTVITIGESVEFFNRLYRLAGSLVPAFWGRQVEHAVPKLITSMDFHIIADQMVRQFGYPSRVMTAVKRNGS
jgi:ubiquinone/menaquinone biosynthesis C-methylase UbiE